MKNKFQRSSTRCSLWSELSHVRSKSALCWDWSLCELLSDVMLFIFRLPLVFKISVQPVAVKECNLSLCLRQASIPSKPSGLCAFLSVPLLQSHTPSNTSVCSTYTHTYAYTHSHFDFSSGSTLIMCSLQKEDEEEITEEECELTHTVPCPLSLSVCDWNKDHK